MTSLDPHAARQRGILALCNAAALAGGLFAGIAPEPAYAQQAQSAQAAQPTLPGLWTWTRKSNECLEQYLFRPDGLLIASSRDARSESRYRMAWAPEPNGRYKVTLETVRDNGMRDCAGLSGDRTGQSMDVWLLFGGSGNTMILCSSINGTDCIGPLERER